jgi:hypothetical protein
MALFNLRKVRHNLHEASCPQSLSEMSADSDDSPIKSVTPLYKGKTVLKTGIFPNIPAPEWESFSGSRQPWERPWREQSFGKERLAGRGWNRRTNEASCINYYEHRFERLCSTVQISTLCIYFWRGLGSALFGDGRCRKGRSST